MSAQSTRKQRAPAPGGSRDPASLSRVMPVADLPAGMEPPDLDEEDHRELRRAMLRIRLLDEKLLLMQRQGRIAFFGPFAGQEAAVVGSGRVARPRDWIFPALREAGILLMRGFPLERYLGQMFGNTLDVAKGRQQPMHFSSREHNFVSLSSVIATQIPQAVGAAWAARIRREDVVVLGYMGDGATSENDFHAGMNFAAVYNVPCVLICQNNQWAISVPFEMQTASEGVAVKAQAYGMPGVAVDGNDVLAVLECTRRAHRRAREGGGPTLLELVTYRRGGHSSSDDPSRYRDEERTPPWLTVDPLERHLEWVLERGLWDREREEALRAGLREEIDAGIRKAEQAPAPDVSTLFEDVFEHMTPGLRFQAGHGPVQDDDQEIEGRFPL